VSLRLGNFQHGDIRASFKRAGRTEIKEVEPVYLEEPITSPDYNGKQRITMIRGKMEKCVEFFRLKRKHEVKSLKLSTYITGDISDSGSKSHKIIINQIHLNNFIFDDFITIN
jgi:hypothetical protein